MNDRTKVVRGDRNTTTRRRETGETVANATIKGTGRAAPVTSGWTIRAWSLCFMGRAGIKRRQDVLQIRVCRDRKRATRSLPAKRERMSSSRNDATARTHPQWRSSYSMSFPPFRVREMSPVVKTLFLLSRGDLSPFIMFRSQPRASAVLRILRRYWGWLYPYGLIFILIIRIKKKTKHWQNIIYNK